jgi:hypothetical protein
MDINVDKLFDFIAVIFSNDDRYEHLNSGDKQKHYFMTNRFFSIMYPVQACSFSVIDINVVAVCDSWRVIGKRYKKVPGWIYTRTKSSTKKKDKYIPSQEAIDYFISTNEIGMREFNDIMKFNKEEVTNILESIDNQIRGFKKEKQ